MEIAEIVALSIGIPIILVLIYMIIVQEIKIRNTRYANKYANISDISGIFREVDKPIYYNNASIGYKRPKTQKEKEEEIILHPYPSFNNAMATGFDKNALRAPIGTKHPISDIDWVSHDYPTTYGKVNTRPFTKEEINKLYSEYKNTNEDSSQQIQQELYNELYIETDARTRLSLDDFLNKFRAFLLDSKKIKTMLPKDFMFGIKLNPSRINDDEYNIDATISKFMVSLDLPINIKIDETNHDNAKKIVLNVNINKKILSNNINITISFTFIIYKNSDTIHFIFADFPKEIQGIDTIPFDILKNYIKKKLAEDADINKRKKFVDELIAEILK